MQSPEPVERKGAAGACSLWQTAEEACVEDPTIARQDTRAKEAHCARRLKLDRPRRKDPRG